MLLDINECVDEALYSCPDEFHECVNDLGTYRCECGPNLYFIDGKCRGTLSARPRKHNSLGLLFSVPLFLLPDFSTLVGIEIKERKKRLVLVNLGFPTNDKGSLDTTFFLSWPLVIIWKGICIMLSPFKSGFSLRTQTYFRSLLLSTQKGIYRVERSHGRKYCSGYERRACVRGRYSYPNPIFFGPFLKQMMDIVMHVNLTFSQISMFSATHFSFFL